MDKVVNIPELVHSIVGWLYEDRPALRSAALVARLWTSAAQAELFRAIHTRTAGDLTSLQHVLSKNRIIANTVRSASIGCTESNLSSVFTFLSHTPALAELELRNLGGTPVDMPPNGYTLSGCSPSKLAIDAFGFSSFFDLIEFLRPFTPLDTLDLVVLVDAPNPRFKPSPPLRIRSLNLKRTPDPVVHLLARLVVPKELKTAFFTCFNYNNLETLSYFCSTAGSHIEHLHIDLYMYRLGTLLF